MPKQVQIKDIDSVSINIASPEDILSWSYGEITKPETINYRTQRPEKEGLFSEKIFGPTKDYECYCGKYKKVRYKGIVCERCGVEVTRANVRRERMGHITLAAPVTHIWFLKTIPSKLGVLLDIPVSKIERVVYYTAFIVTDVSEDNKARAMDLIDEEYKSLKDKKGSDAKALQKVKDKSKEILKIIKPGMIISEDEYYLLSKKFGDVFEASRGAEAVRKILEGLDLNKLDKEVRAEIKETRGVNRKNKLLRRLRLIDSFMKSNTRPEWMIMTVIPVLPPELRPMVALDGGRYATADLNDLYRRVINRNNRLKKLIELNSPDVILTNEKRMLQEAVDSLIDNTRRSGGQVVSSKRRPLKSLSDMLKGKQGRFRRNLLGKRVDYSGRSVIVIGPELELNECGLPKNLALEIFRPFVINKMKERELAYGIKQANRIIEQGTPEVWAILEEVMSDKMVLLNRAPTLHRLGIQAFKPILIEDLVIRIHPLVCAAFNADFDGDQMAVHLPLTEEGQYECRELMDARKNLLKPASGEPIVSPTQDIVLGCYYLTRAKKGALGEGKAFSSFQETMLAYSTGALDLRAMIRFRIDGEIKETTCGRLIFNKILPEDFRFVNRQLNKRELSDLVYEVIDKYGIEVSYRYLDAIKNMGFLYATKSSISLGVADAITPSEKYTIMAEAEQEITKIDNQYEEGLLTNEERSLKTITVWIDARVKVGEVVSNTLKEAEDNSIFAIIDSKARGSWTQLNQVVGTRGLVSNPRGETIELPIKSSYKEGLSVLEFFISTHGARKGSTDTALKTATAGYLTRRLVDVSQDLIIRSSNCRTTAGIDIIRSESNAYGYSFSDRLYSRTVAETVKDGRKILAEQGEIINRSLAKEIEASEVEMVKVRSPITCKSLDGICSQCYGWDLTKEELVEEGEAVGVVAAQSIGEPGTQLTMRTFHIGGVAGVDITHGLPRVEEVFESRRPKGKAAISKVEGIVDLIEEKGLTKVITILKDTQQSKNKKSTKDNTEEYAVARGMKLYIKEGDKVEKGQILTEGPMDLREVLKLRGIEELRRYIINEVQKVYVPEGATINDKHIEIIVRQMLSRVVIKDPGDTDFMIGELVDKVHFLGVNKEMKKSGGQAAKATQKILGITKVALTTKSFLSAASFQETSKILVDAAVEGKYDELVGLKENVIIGKLIPAGTGYRGVPQSEIKDFDVDLSEGIDPGDNNL